MFEPVKSMNWIASLRGLLVLFVYVSPIGEDALFTIGKIGVAGFFLISGFLAMDSVRKRSVPQFLFNRFVRLYPVYWILALLTFLTDFLTHQREWSCKELLANLTFFHQYLGIDGMIGASWMLSIMVIFFLTIAFVGKSERKTNVCFICFLIGALLSSFLRFYFHKPFPTAIFLMSCVGFLGFFYHMYEKNARRLFWHVLAFEIVLLLAGYLSYGHMLGYYLLSYNGAMGLFLFFECKDFSIRFLKWIGTLGFTFFLGARIPYKLLIYFAPDLKTHFYVLLAIHFILCVLFSYLITKYVENPIIRNAKEFEKKLI